MAPASRLELSSIDSSWDTPARPSRRPSSRMSAIDRSWSEPRGVPVVAPEKLATGTAAHAAAAFEDTEPRRFLGRPVIAPRSAPRAAAAAGRPDHDATSLVDPLPAPPRPGAHDPSAPRVAVIPDEHTARSRQRRSDHRRRRVAILAGAIAGVALACGAMVLSSREPDRQAAAEPQRQEPPQPPLPPQRAVVPAAAPAAAPAAPAKPRRASTAAPKKTAAAPKKTAAAPKKTAAAPKRTTAKQPAPTAKQPAPAKPTPAKPAPAKPASAKLAGR